MAVLRSPRAPRVSLARKLPNADLRGGKDGTRHRQVCGRLILSIQTKVFALWFLVYCCILPTVPATSGTVALRAVGGAALPQRESRSVSCSPAAARQAAASMAAASTAVASTMVASMAVASMAVASMVVASMVVASMAVGSMAAAWAW